MRCLRGVVPLAQSRRTRLQRYAQRCGQVEQGGRPFLHS